MARLFNAHGGGGGGAGSTLPDFAKDIASVLFRGPKERFDNQYPAGLGTGVFGDILQGYNSGPADQLFGGLMGLVPQAQNAGQYFGDKALGLSARGLEGSLGLNDQSRQSAMHSAGLNNLNANFLEQSGRGFNNLMGLVNGQSGFGPGSFNRTPGIGEAGRAALSAANNVGPDSKLYKDTLSFLTPQVRSSFAARGMGNSGSAVRAEGDQARQLADSFAQRANAERNAFLGTAVGSEGANASFQGSLNNALANAFGSQVQGATAATEAPGRVFSTLQGGIGQGIQNIGQTLGQYLTPLQINQAGQSGVNAGFQTPVSLQQQIYQFLRSPQTQLMGVPSSTGQQQNKSHPNGILGDLLGFEKGN